jgi:hypothetical protein
MIGTASVTFHPSAPSKLGPLSVPSSTSIGEAELGEVIPGKWADEKAYLNAIEHLSKVPLQAILVLPGGHLVRPVDSVLSFVGDFTWRWLPVPNGYSWAMIAQSPLASVVPSAKTIPYGDEQVPVHERLWSAPARRPYRKTYALKPGQQWRDMPVTEKQWEHYVVVGAAALPVGAVIARELMWEGASKAVFTEQWAGSLVLVGSDLVCVAEDGKLKEILDAVREETGGSLAGLPDVIGYFPDGRIAMREAKNVGAKDKLGPKQHEFAPVARRVFGDRLDLGVVEWGSFALSKCVW